MADRRTLVEYTNSLLETATLRDYSPNGLQVEGAATVTRLVTGVTACQALLEAAHGRGAEAVLVHHGWFWKNEPPQLTGMKRARVRSALDAELNLLAYHLPLDVHRVYGNNAELARLLGITVAGQCPAGGVPGLLWYGRLDEPLAAEALAERLGQRLMRAPLHLGPASGPIKTLAWCTGAGQDFIDDAVALGVDAFISGEVSERTTHTAREHGVHFFSAGHHATERYGVQALGDHLAERFALEHVFVDIDNPA
jgi:dinuclear metal center YbgI/SA1388 family protein